MPSPGPGGGRRAPRPGTWLITLFSHSAQCTGGIPTSSAGRLAAGDRQVAVEQVSEPTPGGAQRCAFIMDTGLYDAAFELADGADMMVCEPNLRRHRGGAGEASLSRSIRAASVTGRPCGRSGRGGE
jgi:hypothetical protein